LLTLTISHDDSDVPVCDRVYNSLDSRGDFMGPLDGFSAPNQSSGIESPMCFAMMQEKIRTQQYSTWRVFVVRSTSSFSETGNP